MHFDSSHTARGLDLLGQFGKDPLEDLSGFLKVGLGRNLVIERLAPHSKNVAELDGLVPNALAAHQIDEPGHAAAVDLARAWAVVDFDEPGHQRLQRMRHASNFESVKITVVADKIFHGFAFLCPLSRLATAPNVERLRRRPEPH
jgi:hypothetical protein